MNVYRLVCRNTVDATAHTDVVVASTPEDAIAAMMTDHSSKGIVCDSPEVSNIASDVIVGS